MMDVQVLNSQNSETCKQQVTMLMSQEVPRGGVGVSHYFSQSQHHLIARLMFFLIVQDSATEHSDGRSPLFFFDVG
jgi:hypothetical protein